MFVFKGDLKKLCDTAELFIMGLFHFTVENMSHKNYSKMLLQKSWFKKICRKCIPLHKDRGSTDTHSNDIKQTQHKFIH